MPAEEILEVADVVEEVATTEETAVPVDLTTVSQQLDQIVQLQAMQFGVLFALVGTILGIAFGKAVAKIWG